MIIRVDRGAGAQLFVDNVTVTESIIAPTISDEMMQINCKKGEI